MKKTVSVNIKGLNFVIEEEAYQLLQDYLDRLQNNLKNEEGSQEIYEDVELRIAELASTKLSASKTVIDLEDIKNILVTLGNPEDFIDEQTDQNNYNPKTNIEGENTEKQLFRDTDNALIAGVCAGIANFFKLDVVIIRALFIVVFFFAGFGFPLYIILWLIVPKAITSIDRLRMKGRPITVESMREEIENASERVRTGSLKFADKIRNNNIYTNNVSKGARIISIFLGLGFIFFGVLFLILFIVFGVGNIQMIPVQGEYGFLSAAEFGELILTDSKDYNTFWWGAFTGISSAVLFAFLMGAMLIFRLYNKWAKVSLVALFIFGLTSGIVCGIVGARTGRDFFSDAEIERELGSVKNTELIVVPQVGSMTSKNGFKVKNDNDGFLELTQNSIIMDHVKFKYIPSTDSLFHVSQNFSARSFSHQTAVRKCENIRHLAKLKEDTLFVNSKYEFPRLDKLRNQKVEIIIEVPLNGKVKIGDKTIGAHELSNAIDHNPSNTNYGSIRGDGQYFHHERD